MHNFSQLLLDCLVHRRDGEERKQGRRRIGRRKKKGEREKKGRAAGKEMRTAEIQREDVSGED